VQELYKDSAVDAQVMYDAYDVAIEMTQQVQRTSSAVPLLQD